MAITYPRPLPSASLIDCTFDLLDGTAMSASHRGAVLNMTRTADPTWRANISTRPLNWMDGQLWAEWSAWKKSMQGGLKTFVAWDVNRPRPFAYPNAQSPADIGAGWNGTATVTSVGLSGQLGLSGLPSTYQAKIGDRVSLRQGDYYGYYEVLESVTASAGAATLTVTPFLQTVFTTSAVARLWRPECRFVIDWRSWQESGSTERKPFSFEAYQRL